ncbi:CPBP family intramembrane glutamic endopeptidase [Lachnoclostridium phytofermentans]|uniref:Abortive infection protein n=1 Tax=Lachnoclostridium phytofermentans (strain ATCC 700394 / DSM 18823 / ISDg) TaxID=357809 RepID=A9KRT8_LACP7|nr:CPBP family intramembrane glutamic endopeptidase [Lachnoclostridium phytofermentans]ABX43582.1 Abortive infection protein [Lachnoclostridium phytofermentans ISDg]
MRIFINYVKKFIWFIILLAILYIIQHLINYLSYYQGPLQSLVKYISKIGIREENILFLLWYVLQIVFTVLILKCIIRKPLKELGFNFRNKKLGNQYIKIFFIIYPIIYIGACLVLYKVMGREILINGRVEKPIHDIIIDILSYGLLPGIGEEPLFRVFVVQFLLLTIFKERKNGDKKTRIGVVLLSSLCFVYGHIYVISWYPLAMSYSWNQLILAFALGIFYAYTYIKTESIYAAIVCHNYSDFVYIILSYIIFYQS